ncbi:MAG: hypothetical protein Q8920_02160 [Bacillota bacterium]|nr:hypothetical protein [Bacillota bacterium]
MKNFNCIPPSNFALIAAFLGVILTEGLDLNEQNAIGNFILSVGQTILTKASQAEGQKEHNINNTEVGRTLDDLGRQIEKLKRQLE